MDIEEVLNKLLGEVYPTANQTIDNERFENLKLYDKALWFIIHSLCNCYDWKDDNRYSAQIIGEKASDILKGLQEELDYILGFKSYEL